jgi:hypothetical protein
MPDPVLSWRVSDRLCIADLADLNSTKNEQEAPPRRPLMMVNIVNVKTDEIRDYPVNVVNMVNVVNVKMVKIRINRDSLSKSGAAFLGQLINQGIETTESILAHTG